MPAAAFDFQVQMLTAHIDSPKKAADVAVAASSENSDRYIFLRQHGKSEKRPSKREEISYDLP
jgi:hypothetical protein